MTLRSALAEGGRLDDYQFSMQINSLSAVLIALTVFHFVRSA